MHTSKFHPAGSANEPHSTLPEVMYSLASLSHLYEIGLVSTSDLDIQELRQHILSHIRRSIRAQGACLLLYYAAQQRFVAVVNQGDKIPGGLLASLINGLEMEQLAMRGPGETLSYIDLNEQRVLLVTLSNNGTLLGLVALSIEDGATLQDERSLLLTYMGNVAGIILHNYDLRQLERSSAIEQERKRIGRELHDGVMQNIAHVLHKLEFIQHMLEQRQPQLAISEVKRAVILLDESIRDMRYTLSALLPPPLERQAFTDALETLLHDYLAQHPATEITTEINEPQYIPSRLELPFFRLIQEALTNIGKHAQASSIDIHIRLQANVFVVEISDNGIGFQGQLVEKSGPGSQLEEHFGLRTMRERVQEAGGSCEIQSRVGGGTTVRGRFPFIHMLNELTMRERDVLRLIVDGLNNREIAQQLAISSDTVKSHIHHIIQKLHVKDRTQAAIIAARYGWL